MDTTMGVMIIVFLIGFFVLGVLIFLNTIRLYKLSKEEDEDSTEESGRKKVSSNWYGYRKGYYDPYYEKRRARKVRLAYEDGHDYIDDKYDNEFTDGLDEYGREKYGKGKYYRRGGYHNRYDDDYYGRKSYYRKKYWYRRRDEDEEDYDEEEGGRGGGRGGGGRGGRHHDDDEEDHEEEQDEETEETEDTSS